MPSAINMLRSACFYNNIEELRCTSVQFGQVQSWKMAQCKEKENYGFMLWFEYEQQLHFIAQVWLNFLRSSTLVTIIFTLHLVRSAFLPVKVT